uniref:Uncharacterized protein n=1 Tax=Arion vulgaris TaxID=1028688 RepID=A0A0B6Y943_9EUPU
MEGVIETAKCFSKIRRKRAEKALLKKFEDEEFLATVKMEKGTVNVFTMEKFMVSFRPGYKEIIISTDDTFYMITQNKGNILEISEEDWNLKSKFCCFMLDQRQDDCDYCNSTEEERKLMRISRMEADLLAEKERKEKLRRGEKAGPWVFPSWEYSGFCDCGIEVECTILPDWTRSFHTVGLRPSGTQTGHVVLDEFPIYDDDTKEEDFFRTIFQSMNISSRLMPEPCRIEVNYLETSKVLEGKMYPYKKPDRDDMTFSLLDWMNSTLERRDDSFGIHTWRSFVED